MAGLYYRIQEQRKCHETENSGIRWTDVEEIKLMDNLNKLTLEELALDHKRSTGSILKRLTILAYKEYHVQSKEENIIPICNKFKIDVKALTTYIAEKEKVELWQCNYCNEKFNKKSCLLSHLKSCNSIIEISSEMKPEEEIEKVIENFNYIYCLREREFLKTGENIFKVGKTSKQPFQRLKNYPKGSELILLIKVDDCHISEKKLLQHLDGLFPFAKHIGREYYAVSEAEIVKEIYKCLLLI